MINELFPKRGRLGVIRHLKLFSFHVDYLVFSSLTSLIFSLLSKELCNFISNWIVFTKVFTEAEGTVSWYISVAMKLKDTCSLEEKL